MKTLETSEPKIFEDYHAQRWKLFKKYLKKYLETKEDEALHQMRVEIKKLTALFHFIDYCDKDFKGDKQLKPIMKVFKLSGKLRDYGNSQLYCRKFGIKQSVLKQETLSQQSIFDKLKWKHKKYKDDFNNLKKKAAGYCKNISPVQLKDYFDKMFEKITGNMQKWEEDELHEMRKKMKEVVYMTKLSEEGHKKLMKKEEMDLLDKIQDKIGEWHDINKFGKKIEVVKPSSADMKLIEVVKEEEQQLLTEISKLLIAFPKH